MPSVISDSDNAPKPKSTVAPLSDIPSTQLSDKPYTFTPTFWARSINSVSETESFAVNKRCNPTSTLTNPLSNKPPKAVSPWLARSDRPGTHSKGRVTRHCRVVLLLAGRLVAKPIVWGILMNKTGKFTCIVLFSRYHRRDFPAAPPCLRAKKTLDCGNNQGF